MRVIDFVSTGAENTIYVIADSRSRDIQWQGTRVDFIREMSAFFILYASSVEEFEVLAPGTVGLYIK